MKATITVLLLAASAMAQIDQSSQAVGMGAKKAAQGMAAQVGQGASTQPAKPAASAHASSATMTKAGAVTTKPAAQTKSSTTAAKPAATMAKAATAKKPATQASTPTMARKPMPQSKPALKPAAAPTKPAAQPKAPIMAKKPAQSKPATPFGKPVVNAVKKTPATAAPPSTPKPTPLRSESMAGKRDPFVSPVVERAGVMGPPCETGKKCLAIGTIVLRGIVKAPVGMIAVVENSRRATYFLHENDPVFNGYVVKITPDSIVFRENILDAAGRTSTHDVVKKMSVPAV